MTHEIAESYHQATLTFFHAAVALSASDLDKKSGADPWTPRMVIHHVADSEASSYLRLRRLVAEPGTLIQGYDEGLWANDPTLAYATLDIEESLAIFRAVRASSYSLIQRLTGEDLKNEGTHSEYGKYTVSQWLTNYLAHPLDHLAQIKSILN
ncbi:MAG: putative metal-dependent hydrolase YfiT [Nitrosomonadaceae bacterium]|jgi:hypothetical protein|nr:putative metal-dependent hydrolase YfiT [Nitrosomonadaceae bacterium]